ARAPRDAGHHRKSAGAVRTALSGSIRKDLPRSAVAASRLERRGIPMALVTGNLTRIGWRKMDRCGLRGYFRYGAFAEMARDRAGLARIAIRHARQQGWIGKQATITLIGDAPSDILAARANRARSVAVRTGISTGEELLSHKPDLLVEDLSAVRIEMLL